MLKYLCQAKMIIKNSHMKAIYLTISDFKNIDKHKKNMIENV